MGRREAPMRSLTSQATLVNLQSLVRSGNAKYTQMIKCDAERKKKTPVNVIVIDQPIKKLTIIHEYLRKLSKSTWQYITPRRLNRGKALKLHLEIAAKYYKELCGAYIWTNAGNYFIIDLNDLRNYIIIRHLAQPRELHAGFQNHIIINHTPEQTQGTAW